MQSGKCSGDTILSKDDSKIDVDDGLKMIMDSNDIKTDTETIEYPSEEFETETDSALDRERGHDGDLDDQSDKLVADPSKCLENTKGQKQEHGCTAAHNQKEVINNEKITVKTCMNTNPNDEHRQDHHGASLLLHLCARRLRLAGSPIQRRSAKTVPRRTLSAYKDDLKSFMERIGRGEERLSEKWLVRPLGIAWACGRTRW